MDIGSPVLLPRGMPRRSKSNGVFSGISMILTGFKEAKKSRKDLADTIRKHGGMVESGAHAHGPMTQAFKDGQNEVVIADREYRTVKYLSAIARGSGVLSPRCAGDISSGRRQLREGAGICANGF